MNRRLSKCGICVDLYTLPHYIHLFLLFLSFHLNTSGKSPETSFPNSSIPSALFLFLVVLTLVLGLFFWLYRLNNALKLFEGRVIIPVMQVKKSTDRMREWGRESPIDTPLHLHWTIEPNHSHLHLYFHLLISCSINHSFLWRYIYSFHPTHFRFITSFYLLSRYSGHSPPFYKEEDTSESSNTWEENRWEKRMR